MNNQQIQQQETQIQLFINDILKIEYLDEMFSGYILNQEENDEFKFEKYKKKFKELITKQPDELDKNLIEFINLISGVNSQKQKLLFSILEDSVNDNVLTAMNVCQNLLNANKLQFTNEEFWCISFNLIMKIIDKADYKEIRDLFKIMLLDIIPNIPITFNNSLLPQLNAIYQIFEYVFDRNLSLFPAYLVFDEIRKKTHFNSGIPHWKFSKLITSFVQSFKPIANMCSIAGRTRLFPIFCYRGVWNKAWQLDSQCKFIFKGLLPFNEELLKPQFEFLKYVLMQPYSKEFLTNSILQLQHKNNIYNRSIILEDIFFELLIQLINRTDNLKTDNELNQNQKDWQILSNNLREFNTCGLIVYQEIIKRLIEKINELNNARKCRDQLMWLFLQLIPVSYLKINFNYFIPFIRLIDCLYIEKEPLQLPNFNNLMCIQNFAAPTIWMLILMKAETDQIKLQRNPPIIFKNYIDFLKQNSLNINKFDLNSDYKLSIIANSYFANNPSNNSNNEILMKLINYLINDFIIGNNQQQGQPLSINFIGSLNIQMQTQLVQNIITFINKNIQNNKSNPQLISPNLLETFFRTNVFHENENVFLKAFIVNDIIQSILTHSYNTLHNLLEAWTFRTNYHHTKLNLSFHLISTLNNVLINQGNIQLQQQQQQQQQQSTKQILPYQLRLCIENCLLRSILKLNPSEILCTLTQTSDIISSKESEEFNKIFILLISRSLHLTGSDRLSSEWSNDLLTNIAKNTPLTWSNSTIKCFPNYISEFYLKETQNENRRKVIDYVDEEYRKFLTISNENDLIQHFTQQTTPTVFICIIWKLLLEQNQLNPISFKILDKLTNKQFSSNIRSFCDYLIFELAKSSGQQLSKYIDTLNDLIWKYYIFPLDKLFLCLLFRPFAEDFEFNICLLILQHILIQKNEFRNRMNEFVKEFKPDHWLDDRFNEKQISFLNKYPENFYFEFIKEKQTIIYPYYYSNVCLRFLPVFDLIIHRYLEQFNDHLMNTNSISTTNTIMDTILDQMSPLYKFHDQPITFLYNTLHYYEIKLRNKPLIKKKLVSTVINSFNEIRQSDWALSEKYCLYMNSNNDWNPDIKYYIQLVGRLVDSIKGKQIYPNLDWKFNEFSNVSSHALYVICVELMALPKSGLIVGNNLLDVIMIGHKLIPRSELLDWINAVGSILTALPDEYKNAINNRIIQMFQSPILNELDKNENIFKIMDFTKSHNSFDEQQITYLIALVHSFYQHSFIGGVSLFPQFLNDKIKPIIKTEEQFIFICHIVAPFLDRIVMERTRIACDITILLYEMLMIVDRNIKEFYYMESICDLLYYIKYSFTGDSVKDDIEPFILKLREPLKLRLRFIVHLPLNKQQQQLNNNAIKSIHNNLNKINQINQLTNTINGSNINSNNTSNQSQKYHLDQSANNYNDTKRLKTN